MDASEVQKLFFEGHNLFRTFKQHSDYRRPVVKIFRGNTLKMKAASLI